MRPFTFLAAALLAVSPAAAPAAFAAAPAAFAAAPAAAGPALTVDTAQDRHPISPYVYGMNFARGGEDVAAVGRGKLVRPRAAAALLQLRPGAEEDSEKLIHAREKPPFAS